MKSYESNLGPWHTLLGSNTLAGQGDKETPHRPCHHAASATCDQPLSCFFTNDPDRADTFSLIVMVSSPGPNPHMIRWRGPSTTRVGDSVAAPLSPRGSNGEGNLFRKCNMPSINLVCSTHEKEPPVYCLWQMFCIISIKYSEGNDEVHELYDDIGLIAPYYLKVQCG